MFKHTRKVLFGLGGTLERDESFQNFEKKVKQYSSSIFVPPRRVITVSYPAKIVEHLTPQFEKAQVSDDIATPYRWRPKRCEKKQTIRQIYERLKEYSALQQCVCLADMQYILGSDRLPDCWGGAMIYAFGSVALFEDNSYYAPCLYYGVGFRDVYWSNLSDIWRDIDSVGLSGWINCGLFSRLQKY
jgi:hypothetical protein